MRAPKIQRQHEAAWERLSPETTRRWGMLSAQAYEAKYRKALDDYFRGRVDSHDLLLARIAWCQAESKLVSERAARGTPEERIKLPKEAGHYRPREVS